MEDFKPIIWVEGKGSLIDFFQVANGLELDYIIYVIDVFGELNSVWATSENDIADCFSKFSNNYFFGRIQKLVDTVEYIFLEEMKKNKEDNGKK